MTIRSVLVTGGAGYVGSVLVSALLPEGYRVRVLDSLLFGGESLLGFYGNRSFEFVRGDTRDPNALRRAMSGIDAVIHLAALVGEPACAQDPEVTRSINHEATRVLLDVAGQEGVKRFVFTSTCSNYGISETDVPADEDAPLNPISLYAETKVASEKLVVKANEKKFCTVVLRLATVFGLSPRMRFDLLLNELIRDAFVERRIMVYGPQSWRPFVHVRDVAAAFAACLAAPDDVVRGQVFNVGYGNYRKLDLVELLRKHIPELQVELAASKIDPRDYRVSFEKVRKRLGFQPQLSAENGIQEITDAIRCGIMRDPYCRLYRNVD